MYDFQVFSLIPAKGTIQGISYRKNEKTEQIKVFAVRPTNANQSTSPNMETPHEWTKPVTDNLFTSNTSNFAYVGIQVLFVQVFTATSRQVNYRFIVFFF